MRKRLRKKRHREFLTTVCAYVAATDVRLREALLASTPGTPFPIDGSCHRHMQRLIDRHRLKYEVALARRLSPGLAVVVYWAEEFPSVCDDAVLFSRNKFERQGEIG